MMFNAAQLMPAMISLLPEITIKHYAYLRDTMPHLVPALPIGDMARQLSLTEACTGSRQFLETLLNNIRASYTAPRARQALLVAAQDDLDRLAAIDPELSGAACYTATFLGAQLIIEQLQSGLLKPNSRTPSKECLNQLLKRCLKLQNLFSALTADDLLMVKQISLRASALHLVLVNNNIRTDCNENENNLCCFKNVQGREGSFAERARSMPVAVAHRRRFQCVLARPSADAGGRLHHGHRQSAVELERSQAGTRVPRNSANCADGNTVADA